MRIVVVGGGGQVGEALGAQLLLQRHEVSFYRFDRWVKMPGVPRRSVKSLSRLEELHLKANEPNDVGESFRSRYRWASAEQLKKADLFIFALPSYLLEPSAKHLGTFTQNKPLLNISDRFLGSYGYLLSCESLGHAAPRPLICFGSPPLLAYQSSQLGSTRLFYKKPLVTASCYPLGCEEFMLQVIEDIIGIKRSNVRKYPSMFNLAMENIQSIVHAVQDLENLRKGLYDVQRRIYSQDTYTVSMIERINAVVEERDKIAADFKINGLRSLTDFDATTFASKTLLSEAGTINFRYQHSVLGNLPTPEKTKAHGFEDIGWSMVTLESFGRMRGISHPALSELIDDWNAFMNVNYRRIGRTCGTLDLETNGSAKDHLGLLT